MSAPYGEPYLSAETGLLSVSSLGTELRFRGTLADLNAAFASGWVRYRTLIGDPTTSLSIRVEVDDLGHSGGAPLTAATVIPVSVIVECEVEIG